MFKQLPSPQGAGVNTVKDSFLGINSPTSILVVPPLIKITCPSESRETVFQQFEFSSIGVDIPIASLEKGHKPKRGAPPWTFFNFLSCMEFFDITPNSIDGHIFRIRRSFNRDPMSRLNLIKNVFMSFS